MVSSQAKVVLAVEVVQILVTQILMLTSLHASLGVRLLGALTSLPFMALGAWLAFKSINCMVEGDCGTFAWVVVALSALFVLFGLIGLGVRAVVERLVFGPRKSRRKKRRRRQATDAPEAFGV